MSASPPEVTGGLRALLAHEGQDPVLEFRAARKMSYRRRLLLCTGLVVVGLALQVALVSVWFGLPFLLAALVLSWVAGFDNKAERRAFRHDKAWETVPFSRVEAIRSLDRKMRRWDFSLFDISNPAGCGTFVLVLAALAVGALWVAEEVLWDAGLIIAVDGVLLLLAQWFSGMRTLFRQPDLLVKVDHAQAVVKAVRPEIEARGELRAQLCMQGKDEKRIPTDLKLAVAYRDAPPDLYGVQAQIVLNRVQGTPYPYFYAVVVAKEGHGLLKRAQKVPLPPGVILETKHQEGVDVAVIRQHTTRTSGYHTKVPVSVMILRTALALGDVQLAAMKAA